MEKRMYYADRRQQTIRSVIYGGIHPRRKHNRRAGDDQLFIPDWFDQGLFMVAMAIILMSCLDAMFTLHLLGLGAQEINYFMRVLIESDVNSFLFVKLGATSLGVICLVAFERFRLGGLLRVRRILESLCALYACLIIWELYLLVGVAVQVA